jgi:FkbM family methyltransferase
VDVGAHSGDILSHIVELAPKGRHHAVEALPNLSAQLETKFPSVQVHSCAVADRTGTAEFLHIVNAPAYSGLRERELPYESPVEKTRVPVNRLDDLIPDSDKITLIKMDIEGGEYHAMLGAENLLQRCHPIVVFEFGMGAADHYGVNPFMMFDLLSRCGLRVSTMRRWLGGLPGLDRREFDLRFRKRKDFYFIAYPS